MASKKYLYKCYKDGTFLGLLPPNRVISEFGYSQDINSAGTQLQVKLAATFDDAGADTVSETLSDENGNEITDENGNALLVSFDYVFTDIPIDLGNEVVVWMYYDVAVNGVQVFDGLISSVDVDAVAATIELTVKSYGIQLDNYLIAVVPGTSVAEQVQREFITQVHSAPPDNAFAYVLAMAQTFQLGSDTRVSGINVRAAKDAGYTGTPTARLTLSVGTPNGGGSVISSVARPVTSIATDTAIFVEFKFPAPVDLIAGVDYSFTVTVENTPPETYVWIGHKNSDVYASGQAYWDLHTTGWAALTADLVFQVIAGDGNAYASYLSTDPSDILRGLLDNYANFGGVIGYDDTTIDNTNTKVTYAFKGNTVFEGIKKVLELAPGNWYWYVDPGTSLLHFHRFASVADHTFCNKKHLTSLNIVRTLDDMKNTVYFSGGDTGGGVNLVKQYANAGSTGKYGNWLQREADSRVTREDTAETISRSLLNQYAYPVFRTEIDISSGTYNIETISLGQMVAFRGFDDFTNSLLLQIVGVNRQRDKVTLRLATNPPSVSHRIEDIKRNLDALYTVNNPVT